MGKKHKDNTPVVENEELADALGLDLTELEADLETAEEAVEAPEDVAPESDETDEVVAAEPEVQVEAVEPEAATEVAGDTGIRTDSFDRPAFRRMTPTRTELVVEKKRPTPVRKSRTPARGTTLSANAALLSFPTDKWGLTKDVKKAITHMASRIAGDPGKKALADATLKILLEHLELKVTADAEYRGILKDRTIDRLDTKADKEQAE
jgi:hypothetical protein